MCQTTGLLKGRDDPRLRELTTESALDLGGGAEADETGVGKGE